MKDPESFIFDQLAAEAGCYEVMVAYLYPELDTEEQRLHKERYIEFLKKNPPPCRGIDISKISADIIRELTMGPSIEQERAMLRWFDRSSKEIEGHYRKAWRATATI